MPKGAPGKVRPRQREKAIERTRREGDLEALAAVWCELQFALSNLPPTPAELERVRLGPDPPIGYSFLPIDRGDLTAHRWRRSGRAGPSLTPQYRGDNRNGGTQR